MKESDLLDLSQVIGHRSRFQEFDAGESDFLHHNCHVGRSARNYADNPCQEGFLAIDSLDLTMVKMKLCLPKKREGKGWTKEQADDCERFYKMFLKLHILYPSGVSIVPTKTLDEMWHAHILDTRAYHGDCMAIFGAYLHHFPYFGLRGEDDAANLHRSFSNTCDLFIEHFGESPVHHALKGRGECCGVNAAETYRALESSLCDGGCAGGGGDSDGGSCS